MANEKEIIKKDDLKYKIEYNIILEYSPETVKLLEKHKVPCTVGKTNIIIEDEDEITKEFPLVPIDEELYHKLKQISEITGISVKEIISAEIKGLLFDHVAENPYVFLENFDVYETLKDPLSIVRKMQPIVNISESDMEELEKTDPIEYLKKWNPLKYK